MKEERIRRRYQLTPKGETLLKEGEFGPQPKLIAQALNKRGQATSADLAAAIESKVETRQPVARVVAYYLTTWKAEGVVKVAKAKAPKAMKKTKKAKPPASTEPAAQVA